MNGAAAKQVSYDIGCKKSLDKLPQQVTIGFLNLIGRYMADPSANGLNLETVEGSKDGAIKSLRVSKQYRAIAFEVGDNIMFVHVNDHDKAYRWASGRRVKLDTATRRIRVVEEIETEIESVPVEKSLRLFDKMSDERLLSLGVTEEELPATRRLSTFEELEASEDRFDATTYKILYAIAADYPDDDIREMIGLSGAIEDEERKPGTEPTFDGLIATDESRQTIFIPESEAELRRVFEEGLEGWRVFLHPLQRRLAERDFGGPALVRGGAGTGKTVVAMQLPRRFFGTVEIDPDRAGRRVLFTTYTTNLAQDIQANLRTLCPEHLDANPPRIEVVHLDRWVAEFLDRKGFGRKICYFGDGDKKLDAIWKAALTENELPDGLKDRFARAEWTHVVQAQGLTDLASYLKASRAGRGTALDRRKRASLWELFADYRARMIEEGLAEHEDAFREATEILSAEAASGLPYAAVVVDEAQDMGEQAFRLIRAIVPKTSEDRNSIFIVGDAHQRIYDRRASMSACGIEVRGRSRQLRLNYRTTQEIREWAVSILEGVDVDDLDEGADTLRGYVSLLRGPEPELTPCASEEEELEGVVAWAGGLASGGTRTQDIGILCNRRKDVGRVDHALKEAGIETVVLQSGMADDRAVQGVRVATMHRAKGLEFHAVAIPFMSEAAFPAAWALRSAIDEADRADVVDRHKSLLHVAATRAKRALRVSWSGSPSPLMRK